MDREKMSAAIRMFLEGVGARDDDQLERTPSRVAQAWCEDLLAGYATDPKYAEKLTSVLNSPTMRSVIQHVKNLVVRPITTQLSLRAH